MAFMMHLCNGLHRDEARAASHEHCSVMIIVCANDARTITGVAEEVLEPAGWSQV